jgi:hypothetical protein
MLATFLIYRLETAFRVKAIRGRSNRRLARTPVRIQVDILPIRGEHMSKKMQ